LQIFAFIISRDEIVGKMRSSGILIGGCGESSIRFRPALIFEPQHADIMIDKFDEVLSKMKWGLEYIFMTYLPMCLPIQNTSLHILRNGFTWGWLFLFSYVHYSR